MQEASRCFALARGDFFQNPASDFLEFAEASEVILKIVVQELRVLRAEFRSQNHVTQLYWMREQRVFLQFLERNLGVVVIHGFPQRKRPFPPIVLSCCRAKGVTRKLEEEILRGIRRRGHEFIAGNSCSNSPVAVLAGFDAHDFANAANTYIARLRDLLGKCDYEINLAADFEIGRNIGPCKLQRENQEILS